MSNEAKTVEAVGWLVVDEEGRFSLLGWHRFTDENAEMMRDDVTAFRQESEKLGLATAVYELRITVPRPSRCRLMLTVEEPALKPTPFATAATQWIEPATEQEEEATESTEDTESEAVETANSAPEAAPSVSSAPSVAEPSDGPLDKAVAFLRSRSGKSAPAREVAQAAGVTQFRIVEDCQADSRFVVRAQGRGFRIQLAAAPRF